MRNKLCERKFARIVIKGLGTTRIPVISVYILDSYAYFHQRNPKVWKLDALRAALVNTALLRLMDIHKAKF